MHITYQVFVSSTIKHLRDIVQLSFQLGSLVFQIILLLSFDLDLPMKLLLV